MAKPSPVSVAFHEAFDSTFLPLLERIGLAAAKPTNVRPGTIVALATRSLAEGRRLDVTLWCDALGENLRLRVDVGFVAAGIPVANQIALAVPWPEPDAPGPTSLDAGASQFLPGESPEQLEKAIAFLAGAFAASSERLAAVLPELAETLAEAAREPGWSSARARAEQAWNTRKMRGEVDERSTPATLVFVGANLVSVDADGERLTFKFDTSEFDRGASIAVSGWFRTPAGTRRATRLHAGTKCWSFDPTGALVR
jgi:hypothetical protein